MPLASAARKSPLPDHFALIPTAWGPCGIVWQAGETPLLARILPPGLSEDECRAQLLSGWHPAREVAADDRAALPAWWGELTAWLQSYYAGMTPPDADWQRWSPRLALHRLTPFQRAILQHVAAIPRGRTRTYGELAQLIQRPKAARAVGGAVGSNPWPILIPCHRVMGANGALTGFSAPGGVQSKQRMLQLEGI